MTSIVIVVVVVDKRAASRRRSCCCCCCRGSLFPLDECRGRPGRARRSGPAVLEIRRRAESRGRRGGAAAAAGRGGDTSSVVAAPLLHPTMFLMLLIQNCVVVDERHHVVFVGCAVIGHNRTCCYFRYILILRSNFFLKVSYSFRFLFRSRCFVVNMLKILILYTVKIKLLKKIKGKELV